MGTRKAFVDIQTGADIDAIAVLLAAQPNVTTAVSAMAGGKIACIDVTATQAAVGDATFAAATDLWTKTAHGLTDGVSVSFTAVGTGATGFVISTPYFVVTATANTFQLAATSGGAAILSAADSVGTWTLVKDGTAAVVDAAITAVAGVSVSADYAYVA